MEEKIVKILPHVQVPSRYTGTEINVCKKIFKDADVRVALCYPDLYEIGMSSLGVRILYGLLNETEGVLCERVFSPAGDMEHLLRENNIPLFTLESKHPVKNFDILGFSISSELNYTNVLNILELSNIPIFSSERKEDVPIILAGGNCTFNFTPLIPFIDCFVVGEGEEVVPEITGVIRQNKGRNRKEVLSALSGIKGTYIPAFPVQKVKKRVVERLDGAYFPVNWIVPVTEIVHDRVPIEIMRGCGQGCFFCQAGSCWRPVRTRSAGRITELALQTYKNTGYEEFSLLSFSAGDHPQIGLIVEQLLQEFAEKKVMVSFPSVRIDTFSFEIATRIKEIQKTGLTFAPETSENLRFRIGKRIKDRELIELAKKAHSGGWRQIKLYFMLGLPGEKDEDILGISSLINSLSCILPIKASFNTFVPKPHTVFERERFITEEEYLYKKQSLVKNIRRNNRIKLTFHQYRMSCVEAFLGRGDEKISRVIYRVWNKGGKMENWDEFFNFALWQQAFNEQGISMRDYLEELKQDFLPWHKILLS